MALVNPKPASSFNYILHRKYTFELADGNSITGKYNSPMYYDEHTGHQVSLHERTKTNLVRHLFVEATQRFLGFFGMQSPHQFEVLNYTIGNKEEVPINTTKIPDILVEFEPNEGGYGNRSEIINYRSVDGVKNDRMIAQAEAANAAERIEIEKLWADEEKQNELSDAENSKRKKTRNSKIPYELKHHIASFLGSAPVPKFKWGGKYRKRTRRRR
jgi:hypothetical protein